MIRLVAPYALHWQCLATWLPLNRSLVRTASSHRIGPNSSGPNPLLSIRKTCYSVPLGILEGSHIASLSFR